MAHQIKALAAKPEDLPELERWEERVTVKAVLWPPYVCHGMHIHTTEVELKFF